MDSEGAFLLFIQTASLFVKEILFGYTNLKLMYSQKATKFCKISTVKVEIS